MIILRKLFAFIILGSALSLGYHLIDLARIVPSQNAMIAMGTITAVLIAIIVTRDI